MVKCERCNKDGIITVITYNYKAKKINGHQYACWFHAKTIASQELAAHEHNEVTFKHTK